MICCHYYTLTCAKNSDRRATDSDVIPSSLNPWIMIIHVHTIAPPTNAHTPELQPHIQLCPLLNSSPYHLHDLERSRIESSSLFHHLPQGRIQDFMRGGAKHNSESLKQGVWGPQLPRTFLFFKASVKLTKYKIAIQYSSYVLN